MGIKHLNKFIRDNYPSSIQNSSLLEFSFQRLAIDTPILVYKYKFMNFKRFNERDFNEYDWLWSFIYFIHNLRVYDVHPVLVFEGKSPPEKNETKQNRQKIRKEITQKTKVLEESLSNCTLNPPPLILQQEWEKILKQSNISLDCPFDIDIVASNIKDRHKYDVQISRKDYKILKILLRVLNVHYIQAPGEAEAYCAFLLNKGLVEGVISNDSDLLTYGCSKLILEIRNDKCQYIDFKILLNLLNFTRDQFIDFCIMCGTDYNNNIPSIGIQRSLKLIKQYGGLDEIIHPQKNCLNYKRVREIFKTYGNVMDDDLTLPYCGKVNIALLTWFKLKFNLKFEPIALTKGFNVSNII